MKSEISRLEQWLHEEDTTNKVSEVKTEKVLKEFQDISQEAT